MCYIIEFGCRLGICKRCYASCKHATVRSAPWNKSPLEAVPQVNHTYQVNITTVYQVNNLYIK